jgi:hypothetical protein
MTFTRIATFAVVLLGCAVSARAQAVKLEFHDGKVNLTAQNASLRAILGEWARLGGTQVVNAERVTGPPVTLQLTDVPETQALDIILRGAAGYIAGARSSAASTGTSSSLDRILVVPTAGTAATVAPRPVVAPPAFMAPPQVRAIDPDDDPVSDAPPDDDPPNRGRNGGPATGPRQGPNQTAPQPFQVEDDQPQEPPTNTTAPTNPFGIRTGSSRPGTISPVPQQPQQPRSQPDPEP